MKNIIPNFIRVLANFNIFVLSSMAAIAGMSNVYAQNEDIPEGSAPWYQIELIIFEYTNTRNVETEIWQQQPGNPEQDLALELMNSRTMLEKHIIPDPYLLLDPEEFQLGKEYNLLDNSPQRNPLLHVAWRQPANSEGESIPIRIHGGKLYSMQQKPNEIPTSDNPISFGNLLGGMIGNKGTENELNESKENYAAVNTKVAKKLLQQIDGTIRISRSRYLHVWTDLVYRLPSANITNISYNTDSKSIPEQPLANFRLQDHRRMRSEELHYIDHPLFGVIVMALPYELPELPVEKPTTEEMIPPGEEKGTKKTSPVLKTGKIRG